MGPSNVLEVTDRDGWRKEFPLQKPLLHVGSDAKNDIVLEARRGGGVAPRHLQLIAIPGSAAGYRAINLSDRDVATGESGNRLFLPRSAMDIADGDCLRLGDFTLVFRLSAAGAAVPMPVARAAPVPTPVGIVSEQASTQPVAAREPEAAGVETSSTHIGLKLSLPQVAVEPEQPLEGMITVRNLGNEPGVQFRLEVEGLDPDWYEIGPGPILFPNVEKGVYFRLRHPQGPGLAAGRHQIQIHASAPDAYPGERVSVSREIDIQPYYRHTLALAAVD
jgi:hypothetical protein